MLPLLIIAFLILAILLVAIRIILSWILPRETMAQLERFVSSAFTLIIQLSIVTLAGLICYVAYLVWKS